MSEEQDNTENPALCPKDVLHLSFLLLLSLCSTVKQWKFSTLCMVKRPGDTLQSEHRLHSAGPRLPKQLKFSSAL